ncbi:hypothetical protein ACHQM5_006476 [Ranunculus cassubicifolius]
MGTKVQCKSYFPGSYFMRDLNEDADSGSWHAYREDKMMMARPYYPNFVPRPATNGNSEYDKELLKQTMLMHEATFKNQVAELHRLYRTQRSLMEELQRKDAHTYQIPVDTTQSVYHSSSSQMPSEDARKMWDISGKPSCSRAGYSSTCNMHSASEVIKSSSSQFNTISGGSLKDCRLSDSNSQKLPKRMFDLDLPADQYIDNEEDKVVTLDNNVNLSLRSSRDLSCQGSSATSDLPFRNKHNLADLNEPIQGEDAASSSNKFLGSIACRGDANVHDSPQQYSSPLGLPREFFQSTSRGVNNGAHNNAPHLNNTACRPGWSPYNLENGQHRSHLNNLSQGLGPEGSPTSSKPIQREYRSNQLPPFLMDGQRRRELFRESENCGLEISKRGERLANQSFSRSVFAPDTPTSYPAAPDITDSGSSSPFSSWKKPTSSLMQSSLSAQSLHCSNSSSVQLNKTSETSIQKNGTIEAQWNLNGHLNLNTRFGNGMAFPNGFSHRPQNEEHHSFSTTKFFKGSDCTDVKSAKGLNLNVAIPNGFKERLVPLEENKNKDQVGGLPWLKMKSAYSENGFCQSQSYSHQSTLKVGMEKDSSSTSIVCDAEGQSFQKNDSLRGKRILGIPIFDKTPTSSTGFYSKPTRIDLTCDQSSENAFEAKERKKGISSARYHFNLNSCADEEEPSTLTSIPRKSSSMRIDIDLEAPCVPDSPEIEEESLIDHRKISSQSSHVESQDQSDEELVRIVAEAIIAISTSGFTYRSEDVNKHPLKDSVDDSLLWFADVVSSHSDKVVSKEKDESASSDSDYFESMTLKLTETKVERCVWVPSEAQNEEDEACASSIVPTRRRRGHAKRGRQRRDFQRDILPGLASLSRHEVTEDIQVIGGLMRATGHPWQSGVSRRNGWARGRRRTRSVAVQAVVEPPIVCSPPKGLDERSFTGWGKTTRRPRRQRVPAGNNISIPITQV